MKVKYDCLFVVGRGGVKFDCVDLAGEFLDVDASIRGGGLTVCHSVCGWKVY